MEIISHRGYWLNADEKNTKGAFQRSFELGYGTETDVRDCLGKLVISHDPPVGGEMLFEEFLKLATDSQPTLALNIKSDGIAQRVRETLAGVNYTNYFVFDMSGPEFLAYKRAGHPTFTRVSEFENPDLSIVRPSGIWLDAFESDNWRIDWLLQNSTLAIPVAIVSPELHGRKHLDFWTSLKMSNIHLRETVLLCTDIPEDATLFFGVGLR